MDKYLIRKPCTQDSSPQIRVNFNLENLPSDPGLRQKISFYHSNNHDEIRRHYLTKGPCQPVLNDFPLSYFSEKPHRFRSDWYIGRKWLEYNIDKDVAFCFYCYLFGRQDVDSHVGGVNSAHSQAIKNGEDLLKEKQHIQSVLVKQSNKYKHDYRVQLNVIVDCIRFLLCRGLAFRGHNESQGSMLQTDPKNCKLTYPEIQKDIVNIIASETSKAIIKDLDNGFFSILVDESKRFFGIVYVASTTALSLKCAIKCLLCEHNLSLSNLRGQGYDRTSNMQGDINGLKTLILKENKSAFYVHCFAHQLQLTLVAVAKNHINIAEFFMWLMLFKIHNLPKLKKYLENGVRRSGQEDGPSDQKVETRSIMRSILSFEFVFALHLMKNILRITNKLLQVMREDECESLLTEVSSFCTTHDISILNIDETFVVSGRSRRNTQQKTNLHHYCVELFYTVINMQLQELNNHFSEANTDFNSFVAFDKEKLIRLAKFYPSNFLGTDILALDSQLQNYIFDMRSNDFFLELQKVKRSFSAMKYIKNELRNRMGDRWMNDCLIVYIEKYVICSIDNETIMQRFQNMKTRIRQL
ncbi:hypothetical protein RGQ29_017548 [Quercus rubra]|uniref:TTF-type domain-containing protein n=1 Tax=Quercus rubra TaxID=3512 RepID=A0AAN7FIE7_QUERU|nr:hypothetical protein RGQ29_017548 [Quercus rubra]